MRLRVVVENDSGRRLAEALIDGCEQLTSSELRHDAERIVRDAMRWMQENQPREPRENQSSLPPNVSPQYTPAATVNGRQPPTVAHVDRSTSAESKEAQS